MKSYWLLPLLVIHFSCSNSTSIAEAPVSVTEGYKAINGSDIYYKTMGSGEPILIVHGGPVMDHSYLLPHFEELAKDYQLIFYDQRACGKSSVEVDTVTMSMAGFVEDIELLRQALDLENIHLLGHSWGGLLAMEYAVRYPEHLRSLILSNSLPASTAHWQEEQQALAKRINREDSLARMAIIQSSEMKDNPAAAVEKLLRLSFKTQFHDPVLLDSLHLFVPADYMTRSRAFQRLGPDLASFDLYQDLARFKKPTLVIYGDEEPAAAISGEKLAAIIPEAEYIIIPESGHFPFIEQPEIFLRTLRQFLSKEKLSN